ncbi:MAG: penicillin-binding protein 1C [Bacteroides sp.]|jgi:penicillin-binding protein 1C|nr:penicillin-binding protein 1C [Bacteroides sp.]
MSKIVLQPFLRKYRYWLLALGLLLLVWFFSLPRDLFPDPGSTVIEDREGVLLGARIADDGQWRFLEMEEVPEQFAKALVAFEDRYFYFHPGVNPLATVRALVQNIRAGRRVSGGSTLSMQVIRLSRKGKPRTVVEKLREMVLATRLEARYSKKSILALYASHAPFGGNVVGLDAAAWRYYGRPPADLSWAEAATLAVLPNAPSLIFPGKNQEVLLVKRNRLLDELFRRGHLDSLDCVLAKLEPLPGKPYPLPLMAPHLLDRVYLNQRGTRVKTTLDPHLQQRATAILEEHALMLRANHIHNAAAIVLEVETGQVLAYVGNTRGRADAGQGHMVDVITAPRSTGSILKPFLYAAMMQEGQLLPNTLVPDIPTQIAGYSPKNYFLTYDGAVPAKRSLTRSLNVPSVRMLRDYGVEKFRFILKRLGMNTLVYPPGHYGLSIILGGAEGSLWDISGMYASLSRVLRHHGDYYGMYDLADIHPPVYLADQVSGKKRNSGSRQKLEDYGPVSAAAVWLTWEALVEVNRPDAEAGWQAMASKGKIAWKTGTSFGGRDAWAVGTTRDYVVGVWVGNATGEGRPELTGLGAAAPILFQLFDLLPASAWFDPPYGEMEQVAVCRESGHRAGMHCPVQDTLWVHSKGLKTPPCPYHQLVHLDSLGQYRVNSDCESVGKMITASWFVLPPAMEWFYRSRNPAYRPLPPWRGDCQPQESHTMMEMIYPREGMAIFVPRELDGSAGKTIFEVAHRDLGTRIFWHLDGEYLGETWQNHQMALAPEQGFHTLTLVDEAGNTLNRVFEIVGKP